MNKTEAKKELKARFLKAFPKCKIACVHLNGFTHEVFYIDENGKRAKATYSAYYVDDANINEQLKQVFSGYYHETYKHNPTELIFMQPKTFLGYPLR